MDEVWAAMAIDVTVAQVDKHLLENAMAEVFVDADTDMLRDIADCAPQDCQAIRVDIVENVECSVNIAKYDQPNVDRKARHSHTPAVESFDKSASSCHHLASGMLEEEPCQSRMLMLHMGFQFWPITVVEKMRRRRAGTGENLGRDSSILRRGS